MYALPTESTTMAPNRSGPDAPGITPSFELPPRNVEYTNPDPLAFNLVTNMSVLPALTVWSGPRIGKLSEEVAPTIYALAEESTAMPRP